MSQQTPDKSSARHPHEPGIPPVIGSDGSCTICRMLVEQVRLERELSMAQDALELRDGDLRNAQRPSLVAHNPTPAMIEAGAQRLVRWETGNEKWPDSWDRLAARAARNEAERVWRSMWLVAHGIEAPLSGDGQPTPLSHTEPPRDYVAGLQRAWALVNGRKAGRTAADEIWRELTKIEHIIEQEEGYAAMNKMAFLPVKR